MPNLFARHLRRNATDAERKFWQELRLLKSDGYHFRRQVPIGGYVADFACYRRRIVIESTAANIVSQGMKLPMRAGRRNLKSVALRFCDSGMSTCFRTWMVLLT